jgi:APA family basic amino acid/polyamine antiporter
MKIFNFRLAISLVVGNMIGAGIFTTTGIQLKEVSNPAIILFIWLVGGMIAMSGAIAYSRIAKVYPRSGGEYHFVGQLYGYPLGFAAGAISLFVGFTAPIALTASAFGYYFSHYLEVPVFASGTICILLFSCIHIFIPAKGGNFHSALTFVKIVVILVFIIFGLTNGPISIGDESNLMESDPISFTGIALALLYASFAYTGWNAAVYILDEIKDAKVNVPRSLILGSGIVTLIYLALNITFLYSTPVLEITGKIEVAHFVGQRLLGRWGNVLVDAMILLALISSLSALILAGSRVFKVMAEDYQFPGNLSLENRKGAPFRAIILQAILAIIILGSFTFEDILTYTGFTLTIFSLLVVVGNLKKVPGNESAITILEKVAIWFFVLINVLLIVYIIFGRPITAGASFLIILIFYLIGKYWQKNRKSFFLGSIQ